MANFAHQLGIYIKERHINITDMAHYCNFDRPTLHKIIGGKRNPPTLDLVRQICNYLNLSPVEQEEMVDAYYTSVFGEDAHAEFESVRDFILNFGISVSPAVPTNVSYVMEEDANAYPAVSALSAPDELQEAIVHLLGEAANAGDAVALIAQPGDHAFFDLLIKVTQTLPVTIRHLLCLNNQNTDTNSSSRYNIECLSQALSLYAELPEYQLYYYYDDAPARFSDYTAYPCLLLSSKGAIIANHRFTNGIYHRDPSVIRLYRRYTGLLMENCSELFHPFKSVAEQCQFYSRFNCAMEVVESLPCLMSYHFLTPEIVDQVITDTTSGRSELMTLLDSYLNNRKTQLTKTHSHSYFTESGLSLFARTGRFPEVPDDFYRPLTPSERITVLENMLPFVKNGYFRILKKLEVSNDITLCLQDHSLVIAFKCRDQRIILIRLDEPRLTSVFEHFFRRLEDYNYVLPQEETFAIIEDTIAALKEKEGLNE